MKTSRTLLCLALSAVLLLGIAHAAPVRDERKLDIETDDSLTGFLSTVMSGAYLKDIGRLAEGEAPSQGLVEAVLGVYEYHMLGPGKAELTAEECRDLYGSFFSAGAFEMPREGDCPCVTVEGDRLVMDLEELDETVLCGAYVYESKTEGELVALKADLYTAWGYYLTPALEIPDEDLTWYCGAEILLKKASGTAFGWQLVSYTLGTPYRDGAMSLWPTYENAGMGVSMNLPGSLKLTGEEADKVTWQDDGAGVTLTLERLPGRSFEEGKALLEGMEGYTLLQEEFDTLMCTGGEKARVVFCAEYMDFTYCLTLTYPGERAEEWSLYAEILRNSFGIWGLSNG